MAAAMEAWIPIVDCTEVAITFDDDEVDPASLQKCGDQVVDALSGIGFVYLRNHGITTEQIKKVFHLSKKFFAMDIETKRNYKAKTFLNARNHGFIEIGGEKLDPNFQYDEIRESFNVDFLQGFTYPSEVESFKGYIEEFYVTCTKLAHRVLTLMGAGLKLEDKYFLKNCHNDDLGSTENYSSLRLLYYPPVEKKDDVIRCGEHSDYGSVTLLFQDEVGGLQVKHRDGSFKDATPIEGTILINIGDLMQRWTADKLVSTKHRVLVPNSEELQKKPRYSIAFFVNPANSTNVECLDKSNKYPPINAQDYIDKRFQDTMADV